VNDEKGAAGAVLVLSRHIDKNLSLGSHLLPRGIESLVIAAENFAVGQFHTELEIFSLRVAEVGEIGSILYSGPTV
jgi:hypothetical protein